MMDYDQIWLTGFMATGKTRTARPLAAALDWEAVDMDKLIEEEAHDGIPAIFRRGGEAAFRVIESQVVERVAQMHNVVVATGGGTVLSETNRAAMKARGFIVCLDARPETIASRIADSSAHISERPLLEGDSSAYKIAEMKAQRDPAYALADFIIQTDDMTPDQVTHQVLLAYRERTAVAGGAA
jgi:shikimate kinase